MSLPYDVNKHPVISVQCSVGIKIILESVNHLEVVLVVPVDHYGAVGAGEFIKASSDTIINVEYKSDRDYLP